MSNKTRSYIVGCLAALLLAACATTEAGGPDSTSPTSVHSSKDVVSSDVSTTTAAPTPTTVPVSAQVDADFETARLARQQCMVDPTTCDFAMIAVPGSPADTETQQLIWTRVEMNLRIKPGFGDVVSKIEATTVSGDTAQVTTCAFDTATLFDIEDPANPDDDRVFDDSQFSTRTQWAMNLVNGKWLLVSATELERAPGADLCAA